MSTRLKVIQPPAALLRSRGLRCSAEREGASHRHGGQAQAGSTSPVGIRVPVPPGICARSGRPGPAASPRCRERALAARG